jgi:MFS family permease
MAPITSEIEVPPAAPLAAPTCAARPTAPTGSTAATSGLRPFQLVIVLAGMFLSLADFFIVNVALPSIDDDLHPSTGGLELVVAAYGIAYAVLLVTGGRLGDAVGRKRLFVAGMAAFTVTSLLCGLAPSIATLVLARAAQGAAAAFMVPQILATIQATSTGPARTRALAAYGATGGIAMVVGQALGGALVSWNIAGSGWRPIFLVNVPIGLVTLVLAAKFLPETKAQKASKPDIPGSLLLAATVLAVIVPLSVGRALGWPAWSWLLLIASPFLAGLLAWTETRLDRNGGAPMLPPSLLEHRSMSRGLLMAVPFFTSFGAFMFVYTVAVQQGAHLTPLHAGLALVPCALGFLVASLSTPRLLPRYGTKVLTAGALIAGLGQVVTAIVAGQAWPHLTILNLGLPTLIVGIGQGLVLSPLFGVLLSEVPVLRAGTASGMIGTVQQTALACGVATIGSLFLSLSAADSLGLRDAFVLVLAIEAGFALLVAALSRLLPDPRRAAATAAAATPTPIAAEFETA